MCLFGTSTQSEKTVVKLNLWKSIRYHLSNVFLRKTNIYISYIFYYKINSKTLRAENAADFHSNSETDNWNENDERKHIFCFFFFDLNISVLILINFAHLKKKEKKLIFLNSFS